MKETHSYPKDVSAKEAFAALAAQAGLKSEMVVATEHNDIVWKWVIDRSKPAEPAKATAPSKSRGDA